MKTSFCGHICKEDDYLFYSEYWKKLIATFFSINSPSSIVKPSIKPKKGKIITLKAIEKKQDYLTKIVEK